MKVKLCILCFSIQHDYYTTRDFIQFSEGTGVFAPVCSELNVLLQISEGEYDSKLMASGTEYVNQVIGKFEKMNPEIVNVAGRAYLPEEKVLSTILPEQKKYNVDVYSVNSDFEKIRKEHSKWIHEKTKGLIEADLRESDLEEGKRIYYTTSYFKDDWHTLFPEKNTEDREFTLPDGETQKRKFMGIYDSEFKYEKVKKDGFKFKMVALPYKEQRRNEDFNRYMVYLIPCDKKEPNLNTLWEKFLMHAKHNIKEYLAEVSEETVYVDVPKINELMSEFDLTNLLKTTYGAGPAKFTTSVMTSYLKIDEKGTTAAAVVKTCCLDGLRGPSTPIVIADRPYISFIFDVPTGRVLFVLKDEGEKKEE